MVRFKGGARVKVRVGVRDKVRVQCWVRVKVKVRCEIRVRNRGRVGNQDKWLSGRAMVRRNGRVVVGERVRVRVGFRVRGMGRVGDMFVFGVGVKEKIMVRVREIFGVRIRIRSTGHDGCNIADAGLVKKG